jgi:hypothetical protein
MKKIFAIAVAMMAFVAFAGAAWAQATEPGPSAVLGGRIWTDLGYQNLSKEQTINQKDDVTTSFLQLSGHSYLRGTWTSADKTTGGHVEINTAAKENDTEVVGLRYAYGWWKVGNCQLVAGQTDGWLGSLAYMPMTTFGVTQSGKTGLLNWGFVYSSRSPQMRLEWRSGNVGFSVAAVQPAAEQVTNIANVDMYSNVPRFDVAAEFKAGGIMTTPAFGWSRVNYQGLANGFDDDYNSWIVMLPLKYTVGPFTAKMQLHTGANTEAEYSGELQNNMRNAPKIMPVGLGANKVYDTEEIGGVVALEYAIGALTVTGGYGQVRIENDYWKVANGYKNDSYDRSAWFVALPFAVTKNFTVSPEFQYYMYGDNPVSNTDLGNEWLLGLQCKFLF